MSVTLLKNTNTSSIILWKNGEVLIARGLLPSGLLNGADVLNKLSMVLNTDPSLIHYFLVFSFYAITLGACLRLHYFKCK